MANPLIRFESNEDIAQAELARSAASEASEEPVLGPLAAYIAKCYEEAVRHRDKSITPRLLACQRAVAGEYEPEVLKEIQEQGHATELYFNATRTKSSAAEAQLMDVMGDELFDLEPTPIPSLPDSAQAAIEEEVLVAFMDPSMPMTTEVVRAHVDRLFDERMEALGEEAGKRVGRMKQKIKDQMAEGGFVGGFREFIGNLTVYLASILKGPVIRNVSRLVWKEGEAVVENEAVPTWYAPSPHDFFPAPDVRDIQDGYICERVHYDPGALAKMKGVEGWSAEAIDRVLLEHGAFHRGAGGDDFGTGESDRAQMENRPTDSDAYSCASTVEGVEFWGSVQGSKLVGWGMPIPEAELLDFHEITAIKIGPHVIRAIRNPHPLGLRPYYMASFETTPGSIWGVGLPEKMADCQAMLNGILRAMIDNIALAAGYQVSVDMDAMHPAMKEGILDQFPGKVWQWLSSESHGKGDPVNFWQPTLLVNELLAAAQYFLDMADDRTLIAKFTHGRDDMGGAGDTARGLEMLMDQMGKGIKRVVEFIDEFVIQACVQQIYIWNLVHLEDESLKADAQVVPHGILHGLRERQKQGERQELLASTQNQLDEIIFGVQERAKIYRGMVNQMGLDADDVVPDDEELQRRMEPVEPVEPPDGAPGEVVEPAGVLV